MTIDNIKTKIGRAVTKGVTTDAVVNNLIKAHARNVILTLSPAIADLTDNSGGTLSGTNTIVNASTALVNAANSGTNLASAATTAASFVTVQDALNELYTKAAAYGAKLSLTGPTYNGGGVAVDGTIASIPVTTAAATGAQAATVNTNLAAFNNAFYNLAVYVNQLIHATGLTPLVLPTGGTVSATIAALATTSGTAADPGVTKVALDAELAKLAANVKTISTALNTVNDPFANSYVTAVK